MGLNHEQMATWTPDEWKGETEWKQIEKSKIILWHGYCSVHRRFTIKQISEFREKYPEGLVVVHPECEEEVVASADACGSTEFIKRYVDDAPIGSIIGV